MFLSWTLFLNSKLNFNCRKARYNIFRRIIKKPGDLFEFHVLSKIYPNWIKARSVRGTIPYAVGGLATIYYFVYYGLYIANDWSSVSIFSFNSQTSFTQYCPNNFQIPRLCVYLHAVHPNTSSNPCRQIRKCHD